MSLRDTHEAMKMRHSDLQGVLVTEYRRIFKTEHDFSHAAKMLKEKELYRLRKNSTPPRTWRRHLAGLR